jgi:hypothetical protein
LDKDGKEFKSILNPNLDEELEKEEDEMGGGSPKHGARKKTSENLENEVTWYHATNCTDAEELMKHGIIVNIFYSLRMLK